MGTSDDPEGEGGTARGGGSPQGGGTHDPARAGDDGGLSSVRNRLDALERSLEARRPNPAAEARERADRSNWGMAVRVSADFIAAIFVGAALGWGLDQLAGTEPFGLIVLLLLGFAAGVLNVMRTLGLVAQAPGAQARPAPPAERPSSPDEGARRHDTAQDEGERR